MIDKIDISFIIGRKEFIGQLQKVMGAGSSSTWHMMMGNDYCGRLRKTSQWIFDSTPKTKNFEHLADHFGMYATAATAEWMQPLLVNDFYIEVNREWKKYNILVRQTTLSEFKEHFSVIGRTNTVVLESNRPAYYRKGVRSRQEWKLVSGDYKYPRDIEELQQLIAEHLKKLRLASK